MQRISIFTEWPDVWLIRNAWTNMTCQQIKWSQCLDQFQKPNTKILPAVWRLSFPILNKVFMFDVCDGDLTRAMALESINNEIFTDADWYSLCRTMTVTVVVVAFYLFYQNIKRTNKQTNEKK